MNQKRVPHYILTCALGWLVFIIGLGYVVPLVAQAQPDYGLTQTASYAGIPQGNARPQTLVAQIINIVLSLLGSITLLLIIYSGFLWMTAAGSEEKIAKAKKIMGSAVVGLAIVLASYAISSFILSNLSTAANPPATSSYSSGPPATPTCQSPSICVPSNICDTGAPTLDCSGGQICCPAGHILPP